MNRNVLIGTVILLLLGIVFNYKFYVSNKKEVLSEYSHFIEVDKKIKEITYLKSKYKFNINSLKSYCTVKSLPTKYILKCPNLDKRKFLRVEEIFKRAKISKFSIEKKDKVNVFAEIIK